MNELYVTSMEMLLQCPKLYYERYINPKRDMSPPNSPALKIGNLFHISRQSKSFAKMLLPSMNLPLKREMEAKNLIEANSHEIEKSMKGCVYEQGCTYRDDDIQVRGRIDRLGYTPEGNDTILHLIDYKSSAVDYDPKEIWKNMHQWYIYPAIIGEELGISDEDLIAFSYIVYKKNTSNILPPISHTQVYSLKHYKKLFTSGIKRCKFLLALEDYPKEPDDDKRCMSCQFRRSCFRAVHISK